LGISLLAVSYKLTSQILAFSGLGLAFWGALFLLITPSRYVEGNLLPITVIPSYANIERIINQFNYKGKAFHIPSFPEDVYLPDHLKGLKELFVFIPEKEENIVTPDLQELAKGNFVVENPKGLLFNPPGLRLINEVEKKSRINLTETPMEDLCEILPQNILHNYNLAKEMTMECKEDYISLRITASIYQPLYQEGRNPKSLHLLGCPLISAVGCAIAKASGKPVIIQAIRFAPEISIIEAKYKIIQSN